MNIQAAIFDVYGTLLEVGPPPSDAEARWLRLWKYTLGTEPRLPRLDFAVACNRIIGQQHDASRARGIPHPEILWPAIVREVVPELRILSAKDQDDFILGQIQTGHTSRLSPGAAETLSHLKHRGCTLGIASNAQAYTLRELKEGLAEQQLTMDLFDADLCFWSFQHGFSKPDPHVYQILSARLEARGISRDQILAVGDRLDNDVEPARVHGWHTWHLSADRSTSSGGWPDLVAAFG